MEIRIFHLNQLEKKFGCLVGTPRHPGEEMFQISIEVGLVYTDDTHRLAFDRIPFPLSTGITDVDAELKLRTIPFR